MPISALRKFSSDVPVDLYTALLHEFAELVLHIPYFIAKESDSNEPRGGDVVPLIAALHSTSEPSGAKSGVQFPVHVAVPDTPSPVVVAAKELLGIYIAVPRLLLKSTLYSIGFVDDAAVAIASAHGSEGSMLHDDWI
jgi:hypothetical protein